MLSSIIFKNNLKTFFKQFHHCSNWMPVCVCFCFSVSQRFSDYLFQRFLYPLIYVISV